MKATNAQQYSYYTARQGTPNRYPNSASIQYIQNKIVDALLAAAITVAMVAILFFLVVL